MRVNGNYVLTCIIYYLGRTRFGEIWQNDSNEVPRRIKEKKQRFQRNGGDTFEQTT